MDFRLLFTQKALNDLADLIGHIEKMIQRLPSAIPFSTIVERLTKFPRIGNKI